MTCGARRMLLGAIHAQHEELAWLRELPQAKVLWRSCGRLLRLRTVSMN